MARTGVRETVSPEGLTGLSRAERIEELRGRMSALGADVALREEDVVEDVSLLDIDGELGKVLPGGGLPRKAATEMSDCPALVIEAVARVSARGGYVGVVGWPELSFAGVVESGGDLSRVLTVPDPGPDPLNTSAVLTEGLDLVVHHAASGLNLSPVRARPLLGRLRGGRAALLVVGLHLPSPAVTVAARVTGFHGLKAGAGRIRGLSVSVAVRSKGSPRTSAVITLGTGPDTPARTGVENRRGLRAV